jgi:hypothetical protein
MLVVASFASAALALDEAASPARKVVEESFSTFKAGKFEDYTGYLHPDDVAAFAKLAIELAELAERNPKPETAKFLRELGSPNELKNKAPREVMAIFLKAVIGQFPEYEKSLTGASMKVLGEVAEGDRRSVVVHRELFAPKATIVVNIGGKWVMRIDPAHQELAASLKRSLTESGREMVRKLLDRKLDSVKLIGVVNGMDESSVVYRSVVALANEETETVMVATIRAQEDEYRLLAKDQWPQLELALKRRFEAAWEKQKGSSD